MPRLALLSAHTEETSAKQLCDLNVTQKIAAESSAQIKFAFPLFARTRPERKRRAESLAKPANTAEKAVGN
jgi:hypothetical protein